MEQILKATHEGKLEIGETVLNVAVLNDGTRIITQAAVFKAFGRTKRGRAKDDQRVPNMPAFIDAKNLQPFIDEGMGEILKKIDYFDKNGSKQEGHNAEILPRLCKVYLDARDAKSLLPIQEPLARASEILLYGLSKVGIVALVDEATGYQHEREHDELQQILRAYISEELLPWQKRFPDIFYKEIFRLNGWNYTVSGIKNRPGVIGTWTNNLIYKKLPKQVLDELRKQTPTDNKGRRKHRFHQLLTEDVGHPHLQQQLTAVITIMRLSKSWTDFVESFNQLYGQTRLGLDFTEE